LPSKRRKKLEHHQYNDIHLFSSERKKGIVGTSILHLSIIVLMLLVGISAAKPPYQDSGGNGILVNFGTDETGSGLVEPSPPPAAEETPVAVTDTRVKTQPVRSPAKPAGEKLVTQDYEKEAPVIKKVDPEAEKRKKEQQEAARIKREELRAERERIAAADAEKKRIEAEQKRSSDILNRTKNALASSRNSGTNSTSEGITGGTGNQGDPNGSVNSKVRGTGSGTGTSGTGNGSGTGTGNGNGPGVSYSLEGRGIQTLPMPPYTSQADGRVVVDVSVDRSGKVIEAKGGQKGSTTLDPYLISVSEEAALKATFQAKPDAPLKQKGTITYNFVLK
jgi:colicin import membrane protein